MRIKLKVIIFFFISSNFSLQAQIQNTTRGIHINNFKEIIGNQLAEDEMLSFVQKEGFNYLLLYNLHHIHTQMFDITNKDSAIPLINFIKKAKTQYGIIEVGGVGEKFASFNKMTLYNKNIQKELFQKIDVFHLEFEFWNDELVKGYYCDTYLDKLGYPCTKEGAFDFYYEELKKLEELSNQISIKSETYIGNPKNSECKKIGENVDRLLVHYYQQSDVLNAGNSIYNFKKYRLKRIAPEEGNLKVLPLFSSKPYHMGTWLMENNKEQAIETWWFGKNGFYEDLGNWKNHLKIEGFHWYNYTNYKYFVEKRDSINGNIFITSQQLNEKFKILIYPNPSNDWISFYKSDNLKSEIQIFDKMGRKIWQGYLKSNLSLEVGDWEKGVYILKSRNSCFKFVLQ